MKKRHRILGVTGIAMQPEGTAVARVVRDSSQLPPRLSLCEFHPHDPAAPPATSLQALSHALQLDSSECVSVAAVNSFSLLMIEAPEVDATELKAAVRWKIKDLLDYHIDDAVIDVFDIPGQKGQARQKMMYVVASRRTVLRDHIDLLEQNGIALEVIDIPELAMRNIAALLPENENGVATLWIGDHGGLLTLVRDGNLYLARGIDLTQQQLVEAAQPDPVAAAGEFGLEPLGEGGVSLALQRQLDGVILEVQRSLDYYESHFALPSVAGLVVAPTAQPIAGMIDYFASNLGVPVRTFDINALLTCDQYLDDPLQSRALLAIGAALRQQVVTL